MIAPGAAAALKDVLQPGERVLWSGRPDPVATLRTQMLFWWIGMPGMVTALSLHFFGVTPPEVSFVAIAIAGVFLAAPFLSAALAYGTIDAITDRRALIRHDAIGKRQLVSYALEDPDNEFEILDSGRGVGHRYFASGARSKVAYADHSGRVAFREPARPREVAALLDKIRADRRRGEAM